MTANEPTVIHVDDRLPTGIDWDAVESTLNIEIVPPLWASIEQIVDRQLAEGRVLVAAAPRVALRLEVQQQRTALAKSQRELNETEGRESTLTTHIDLGAVWIDRDGEQVRVDADELLPLIQSLLAHLDALGDAR